MFYSTREIGTSKEDVALQYLLKKGWKLLAKNYRSRRGEIDLIFEEGSKIIFVEVKYRSSLIYGYPQEAVTKIKRGHISRTALMFVKQRNLTSRDLRFDVVSLYKGHLEHIPDAFSTSKYAL